MARPLSLLALILISLSGTAAAQNPPLPGDTIAADFPLYDLQLLLVRQRGLNAAAAALALAQEPDSVATLKLLLAVNRVDDAIGVVRRIVADHPDRLLPALQVVARGNPQFIDAARGHADALQQIARDARARLLRLPREEAARVARQITMIERRQPSVPGASAYDEALAEFVRDYAGTEEAQLAEVDRMTRGRPSLEQVAALEAFARAHSGTVAGAKALFMAGRQLSVNIPGTGVEPRDSDPTARLMRVMAIVKELESGAHPRGEWIDRLPELFPGYFASNSAIAPENVDKLASEYVAFARAHLPAVGDDPAASSAGYLLTERLAALYKFTGDPVARVERTLDQVAKDTGRSDMVYLKAHFYMRTAVNDAAQRAAMSAKAMETLRALSEGGTGLVERKSLATLACMEFEDRDYRHAVEHFTQYVRRYPDSPYAWVAALRAGRSHEALGDWNAAVAAYRAAAANHPSVSVAQVLGHEYAARGLEALERFADARQEHEAALRAWDPLDGQEYPLPARQTAAPGAPIAFEPVKPVTRDALRQRIAQLRSSLAHPSGPLLERGRWLLAQDRRDEAARILERLLRESRTTSLAGEARLLMHHARLESALALANVESASRDAAAALAGLTALTREPYDETICVAGIARATLLAPERPEDARTAMRETLTQCRDRGGAPPPARPHSGIAADILAVRNAVFLPAGGGVYGSRGWNAFSWPASAPPFLLVNPAVTVTTADGTTTPFVFRDAFPGIDNVVFFSGDQLHLLNSVMTALGGTKRFVPASVMATPNQPAGAAVDVRAFWNQFFPCRAGHWFGWEFEAYPQIAAIQFLDAERTKAAVPVAIGYSGATVVLEKRDGVWRALRLTNEWIT